MLATNEGQQAIKQLQAKWQPKKLEIDKLSADVASLKKQMSSAPGGMTASLQTTITAKERQINSEAGSAQAGYNADLQRAYGKIAPKVRDSVIDLIQRNGYSALIDVGVAASTVMWANPATDISQATVDYYNRGLGDSATQVPSPAKAALPGAIPARVALVAFEQAVLATKEGQQAVKQVQAKWQPKKIELDKLSADVESPKKQVSSAPGSAAASLLTTIASKENRSIAGPKVRKQVMPRTCKKRSKRLL